MNWYLAVLRKYAVFEGRASRTEYWMFTLLNMIFGIVLGIVDSVLGLKFGGVGVLGTLYSLALLIPGIAVGIRRLHDTGRSGWWLLIALTIIGVIVLIVFYVQDSDAGDNTYGPNPKSQAAPATA